MIVNAPKLPPHSRTTSRIAGVALAVTAIVVAHAVARRLPDDVASPLVIASHLYAVVLAIGLLWLAGALGMAILSRAAMTTASRLEHAIFSAAIGLGLISMTIVWLGVAQVLSPPTLGVMVAAMAFAARRELVSIWRDLPHNIRAGLRLRGSVQEHGRVLALLVPVAELLFAALLLRALAPPFESDALVYHLRGPQLFLGHGGLKPLPDIQQANMPLAVDMLYLLGLAFGSDELGGVLHLALAGLVVVATFSFARRFFGTLVGWIAATTCLSTQLLLEIAPVALIDYGLTLFDFLAVYAFIVWRESRQRRWLVVAGTLVGCALATKHLGVITAISLSAWLLVDAGVQWRRSGLRSIIGRLIAFGLPAALVVAPWYLKNLVWFGNPVWPILAANTTGFNQYLGNTTRFPGTDGPLGPVLLSAYMYLYGSLELSTVRPPLQLFVIPLYLLLPKHRIITALLCLASVQFLVWSQGAHLLRYALPGLPGACIVAAYVLAWLLTSRPRGGLRAATASLLILVGLALPTAQMITTVLGDRPFPQLVGMESRQNFLSQRLDGYPLLAYLNDGHEPVSKVLTIGDNRTYYLHQPAWADITMETFQQLATAPDAAAARRVLAERDISHVLVSSRDLLYFVPVDPSGQIMSWWQRFEASRSAYLEPIAASQDSTLYRVRP